MKTTHEIYYGTTRKDAETYGNNYITYNPQIEFTVEETGTKKRPYVVVAKFKEVTQ